MFSQAGALGLTLLVEVPIVLVASRSAARAPAWRIVAALLPSCLTHPFAWHAIGNFGAHDYLAGLLLIELIVVLVEALLIGWLAGLRAPAAIGLSVLANAASALAGWALA
jgi:uncharacterized protein (DUF736 family)